MTNTKEPFDPLKSVIAVVLGQNEDDITTDTKFADIIGNKQKDLIIGVNQKFETALDEREMGDFTTVADLVAWLEKQDS